MADAHFAEPAVTVTVQAAIDTQEDMHMSQHPAHSQDQRHPGQPNPADIEKAIAGVAYPTTREKLVAIARQHHANTDIIDLIARLPDQNYDSVAAVSKQMARVQ